MITAESIRNGKAKVEFRDIESPRFMFDEIIAKCKERNIEVTKDNLEESLCDWENDYKSSINLPNGYNLYHACGCNSLYFSFFYDPEYPEYKA